MNGVRISCLEGGYLVRLYVDLGDTSCNAVSCGGFGAPTDVDFRANVVRAGVNYRF